VGTSGTWPDLERLVRLLRAADSFTAALGAWTGAPVTVTAEEPAHEAPADPDGVRSLGVAPSAPVQHRRVRMRCGGRTIASATAQVAVHSSLISAPVRLALRAPDSHLGELLRPRRRVALRITRLVPGPTGDPARPVLAVDARLDVAGSPVALLRENVHEAALRP
jgi:chorismate-pyruvate lyase